jgi:hypothetical protein
MCMHTCTYIHAHLYVCVYRYIYTQNTWDCGAVDNPIVICLSANKSCTCICAHANMHIYIYMHTHTWDCGAVDDLFVIWLYANKSPWFEARWWKSELAPATLLLKCMYVCMWVRERSRWTWGQVATSLLKTIYVCMYARVLCMRVCNSICTYPKFITIQIYVCMYMCVLLWRTLLFNLCVVCAYMYVCDTTTFLSNAWMYICM